MSSRVPSRMPPRVSSKEHLVYSPRVSPRVFSCMPPRVSQRVYPRVSPQASPRVFPRVSARVSLSKVPLESAYVCFFISLPISMLQLVAYLLACMFRTQYESLRNGVISFYASICVFISPIYCISTGIVVCQIFSCLVLFLCMQRLLHTWHFVCHWQRHICISLACRLLRSSLYIGSHLTIC